MQVREHVTFIAADGSPYELHVPSRVGRWVMSHSGLGTPPLEFITERGPFQHGETVKDIFLRPRVVQLLIRQQFCNREAYWSGRASLLDAIRPNRQATPGGVLPGTLRFTLPTGARRALDCYIQEGPRFEPRQQGVWDEWAFQEVLRFIAYNPVLYDPTVQTTTFQEGSGSFGSTFPAMFPIPLSGQTEFVFPIIFPIVFEKLDMTSDVTYTGTWLEYPTITLIGPLLNPVIVNETTGETIALTYSIPDGVTVTINLAAGNKSVMDSTGANLIGVVTPDSDLGTWHLASDPEAPGGINTIHVEGTDINVDSAIVLTWHARYIGI